MSDVRNQIPEGVKDRLPREAARVRALFGTLGAAFGGWGYREVVTPTFEYLETATAGAGARREDLYQFFDRKGRTLALRPDMTNAIARLAATKLAGEPMPLRLAYYANVFRHRDRKSGSLHEIWQAGVELVGAGGTAADAEVIALACAALAETGLDGYKIGLGHVDFVEGLFAEANLPPEAQESLKEALVARDLVAFEKEVFAAGLSPEQAELVLSLATFTGSYEQALSRYGAVANERLQGALRQVGDLLVLLEAHGVAEYVSVDLGLARGFGYYTGILFEGYAPGVGAPVLGGGRYDRLLTDFGGDAPATGFAIDAERLLAALERQGRLNGEEGPDVLIACRPGEEAAAIRHASELRARGRRVEIDLLGRTGAALEAYGRARGAREILQPGSAEPVTTPARSRSSRFSGIH
jgi:ATP phosphoribosyltransferase regulatory subunit